VRLPGDSRVADGDTHGRGSRVRSRCKGDNSERQIELVPLEVADIFRTHGPDWRKAQRAHLSLGQFKVMSASVREDSENFARGSPQMGAHSELPG